MENIMEMPVEPIKSNESEMEAAWAVKAREEEMKVIASESAGYVPYGTWNLLKDDILTYRRQEFETAWNDRLEWEKKKIDTDEDLIKQYKSQRERRFEIFADGSGIMVGPDDYVLVGALSGQGKSTFGMQSVCHAVARGRKALYVSAEEGEAQILDNMDAMFRSLLPYNDWFTIPKLRSVMCRLVGPRRSGGASANFDMVMDIVQKEVRNFEPDIVVLDNLNVMVNPGLAINKIDKRFMGELSKPKIDYLSHEIFKIIQREAGFPAIIALQQLKVNGVPGYKNATQPGQMQSHLADTSKTLKDSTLALMIMRDQETGHSLMHLGKNRDMRGRKIDQTTTWYMPPGIHVLNRYTENSNPWLNQGPVK